MLVCAVSSNTTYGSHLAAGPFLWGHRFSQQAAWEGTRDYGGCSQHLYLTPKCGRWGCSVTLGLIRHGVLDAILTRWTEAVHVPGSTRCTRKVQSSIQGGFPVQVGRKGERGSLVHYVPFGSFWSRDLILRGLQIITLIYLRVLQACETSEFEPLLANSVSCRYLLRCNMLTQTMLSSPLSSSAFQGYPSQLL